MKKITLFSFLFFSALISNAQQILQEEGFASKTIPAGWTSNNATSGCDWKFGYTGNMPQSGNNNPASFPSGAALFDDVVCGAFSSDLITLTGPEVDVSAYSNAEIEIVYNLQVFSNKGEFIVDVFDGTQWNRVFFQDVDSPKDTGENQKASIDVSPYLNSQFKVRFTYNDEGFLAWGLGIDDYKLVHTSTASVEDLAEKGFHFYPNPSSDVLNLVANENIEKVLVYNILGQVVMNEMPSETQTRINMERLPAGTYMIQVQIGDKLGTYKVLKN